MNMDWNEYGLKRVWIEMRMSNDGVCLSLLYESSMKMLQKYYLSIITGPTATVTRSRKNKQFVQSQSLSHTCVLSLPDLLDGGGKTNIVSLELVPAPADNEDGEEVKPVGSLANEGNAPRGEVVGDAGPVLVVRKRVDSVIDKSIDLTGSPCMYAG
jgi:hypothetical protein